MRFPFARGLAEPMPTETQTMSDVMAAGIWKLFSEVINALQTEPLEDLLDGTIEMQPARGGKDARRAS